MMDSPLLLLYQLGGPSELTAQFYVHENLEDTPYEVVNKTDLWMQFIHLRLQTRLPLTCELQADAISEAVQLLEKKVGGICSLALLRGKVVVGFVGQGNSNVILVLCVGTLPYRHMLQTNRPEHRIEVGSCLNILASLYTGCPRRNGRNFGRVFLMLNYTDITQNTYIQS